jgi:hypothetical protein
MLQITTLKGARHEYSIGIHTRTIDNTTLTSWATLTIIQSVNLTLPSFIEPD